MTLKDLGFNATLAQFKTELQLESFETGRVIAEHKERYIVRTDKGEYEAEITGNMRFTAKGREDFPAVGDWVALSVYGPDYGIIHAVFPRISVIKRQAVGQYGEVQIIAANIDYAFIVQAVGRDFNVNRLERYLTICNTSKVAPIIVLTKIDLVSEPETNKIIDNIKARIKNVPVIAISNETKDGYSAINKLIEKGKTYCLLGSSGVGKSTLLNNLSGKTMMKTGEISQSIQRGKHVTSHRELIMLDNGGILIDNPGMREVGIADSSEGLEMTFDMIFDLSKNCKFKDCTHTHEVGCAVLEAIENGELNQSTYENFLKMQKENAYFTSTVVERRQKDKAFGKMLKNYKKNR